MVGLVTVLMPVYNAIESEFRAAIECILNQTYKDFEFLIINDGSTNNCDEVVFSYNDKRIRYIKNDGNLKIIKTLNKGLDLARGNYIARMDADDLCDKTRIEKQVKFLDENPEIGLVATQVQKIPKGSTLYIPSTARDFMLHLRYVGNCIVHSSVMIRKSVLDENNLRYDKNCLHAEDFKLWSDMTRYCNIGLVPEVLTSYRMSPEGISRKNSAYQAKMVTLILLDNIIRDFGENKEYLYSILVKYVKNTPVTDEEFRYMNAFLIDVTNYVQREIAPPFDIRVKNHILSILAYFIRA